MREQTGHVVLTIEYEIGRGMMNIDDVIAAVKELIVKARELGSCEPSLLTFEPPLRAMLIEP